MNKKSKQCSRCEQEKPFDFFPVNPGGKNGRHSLCLQCNKAKHRAWYLVNRDTKLAKNAKWKKNNADKRRAADKKWDAENIDKVRAKARKHYHKVCKDPHFRINDRMSSLVYHELRHNKQGRRWSQLVGYSVDDLKQHLESLFCDEMTWARFVKGEIHIDHIIPRSAFKFNSHNDEQFKKCWDLSNLQPLWAKDNYSKGAKILKEA